MNVIGFDLSLTATGVCWDREGTATLRAPTHVRDDRLLWLYRQLRAELLGDDDEVAHRWGHEKVDLVVVEAAVAFGKSMNGASVIATGELHGVARLALRSVPVAWVSPATLKKIATGRGNATKPDLRVELYKRTNLDLGDDNQVDAWWLWCAGMCHLGEPPIDLPKAHLDALAKVEWP